MAWLRRSDRRQVTPPARRSSSTVSTAAYRLVKGAMVLTSSTPYRYRVERVLWIEKPQFGPVIANLEGTDPDTGATQQRWHQWRPSEMVTVFTADVEVEEHGGSYDELIRRYSGGQPAEQAVERPQEDLSKWHRAYG